MDQRLSAQRALAEELYRSRHMLQSILNTIPQRVFWKGLTGQYLGCNQAFATDAGTAVPEEVVGRIDAELPRMCEFSAESDIVTNTGMPVLNAECQTIAPDGQQRWFRGSTLPLRDSQQRLFGVLGVYEDVTERKTVEDAIKRSNIALAEFAHVVSHDLQSPVRTAKIHTQLVSRKYGKHLDAQGRDFLLDIEASLTHMQELIRSLLAYATATESKRGGEMEISLECLFGTSDCKPSASDRRNAR